MHKVISYIHETNLSLNLRNLSFFLNYIQIIMSMSYALEFWDCIQVISFFVNYFSQMGSQINPSEMQLYRVFICKCTYL